MDTLMQDVRFAVRSLRRAPGMTLVALVTLSVGIATVSTIFGFVNSVLYRALPFPNAHRIVALSAIQPGHVYTHWSSQPLEVVDAVRAQARSFERVAAFREEFAMTLSSKGIETTSPTVTAVDSSVLPLLGTYAQRGRLMTPREVAGGEPVAMISDSIWRSRFGAAGDAVGRTISLNGTSYQVVGILPPGIRFYERSDLLIPLAERLDTLGPAHARQYSLIGALRRGVSPVQAQAELKDVSTRLAAGDSRFRGWTIAVRDGMYDRNKGVGPSIYLWMFVAAGMLVLLIACTNVTNLLLVSAAERRPEMAIRTSLGAGRMRLVRQALMESVILAACAGAGALLLTIWGQRTLSAIIPLGNMPSFIRWGLDVHVVEFTALLSLIVVAAVGVTPALEGTRLDLVNSLKAGGSAVVTRSHVSRSARRGVVAETTLAMTMFIVAALLWRSYGHLTRVDPGIPSDRIVQLWMSLNRARYPDFASSARFANALSERLAADPAVAMTAVRGGFSGLDADQARALKQFGQAKLDAMSFTERGGIYLPSDPARPIANGIQPTIWKWAVSDGYFQMVRLPMLRGRAFDASVHAGSAPSAVVSQAFARLIWHDDDVIGKTFVIGAGGTPIAVIGVAQNTRRVMSGAGGGGTHIDDEPIIYMSERQVTPTNAMALVVPRGDISTLQRPAQAAVASIDPEAVIAGLRTLAQDQGDTLMIVRIFGTILGGMAVCALLLAIIGTYGVIAYGVTQRTREIGLRLALGATPRGVVKLFVAEGMRMIAIALGLGFALTLAASQVVRVFLLGVSPFDPITYAAVLALFTLVAFAACWFPARRATRVSPMSALRAE